MMAAFHLWEAVLVLCTLAGHNVISFTCAFPARKIQIVCCEKVHCVILRNTDTFKMEKIVTSYILALVLSSEKRIDQHTDLKHIP